MIDYDKLKIAHELAQEYSNTKQVITIAHTFWSDDSASYALLNGTDSDAEEIGDYNIDGLISKLEKMTKTKPKQKYAVGDVVWWMDSKGIYNFTITQKHLELIDEEIFDWSEDELYPTREALIEAQIEYWLDLRPNHGNKYSVDTYRETSNKFTIAGRKCPICESDMSQTAGRVNFDSPWLISCANSKCSHIELLNK